MPAGSNPSWLSAQQFSGCARPGAGPVGLPAGLGRWNREPYRLRWGALAWLLTLQFFVVEAIAAVPLRRRVLPRRRHHQCPRRRRLGGAPADERLVRRAGGADPRRAPSCCARPAPGAAGQVAPVLLAWPRPGAARRHLPQRRQRAWCTPSGPSPTWWRRDRPDRAGLRACGPARSSLGTTLALLGLVGTAATVFFLRASPSTWARAAPSGSPPTSSRSGSPSPGTALWRAAARRLGRAARPSAARGAGGAGGAGRGERDAALEAARPARPGTARRRRRASTDDGSTPDDPWAPGRRRAGLTGRSPPGRPNRSTSSTGRRPLTAPAGPRPGSPCAAGSGDARRARAATAAGACDRPVEGLGERRGGQPGGSCPQQYRASARPACSQAYRRPRRYP